MYFISRTNIFENFEAAWATVKLVINLKVYCDVFVKYC